MRRKARSSDHSLAKHAPTLSHGNVLLPLVHITAVGTALEILESGYIEPRLCKIFRKELVYFFVMRPTFHRAEGDAKSHLISHFPFAFITKADAVNLPYHVYPFDTGGAVKGIFGADNSADPCLEDYELPPERDAANRHINWAFDSLEDYLDGLVKSGLVEQIPRHDIVAHTYYDIARSARSGANRPDSRASSVEVAAANKISLKQDIELAIVPKQLMEDKNIRNARLIESLEQYDIQWRAYDWQPNSSPNAYLDELDSIARNWYRDCSIL